MASYWSSAPAQPKFLSSALEEAGQKRKPPWLVRHWPMICAGYLGLISHMASFEVFMTVFQINCTLPQERAGLVLSPNSRGTFDIIWSCFSIFVLSTWSILHLNVPTQTTPEAKAQRLMRKIDRFCMKFKWMAVNILAPEWVLGRAWSDFSSVLFLEETFKTLGKKDQVPWTRTHTYFANMGGFAIKFSRETCQAELGRSVDAPDSASTDTAETSEPLETSSAHTLPGKQHLSVLPGGKGASDDASIVFEDFNLNTLPETSTPVSQVPTSAPAISRRQEEPSGSSLVSSPAQETGLRTQSEEKRRASGEIAVSNENSNRDTLPVTSTPVSRQQSSSQSSSSLQDEPGGSSPRENLVEKRASRTPVDEEKGEHQEEQIPAYIRTFLRNKQQHDICSKSFEKRMKALGRGIGSTDWTPDSVNMRVVEECLDVVTMEHFETEWERFQFLNSYNRWFYNLSALQGDLWTLDAQQLLVARDMRIIESLPKVRTDELDDRNKGDALIKVLALGQVAWFVIQVGVRLRRQIPTSQLEIVALSYTICIALAYYLLLDKPQDVTTAIHVNAARYPTTKEMIRIAIAGPFTWGSFRQAIRIPNNAIHRSSELPSGPMVKMFQGIILAVAIFGGVHCVAWDFEFPTQLEKLLWRICSVATIALPLFMVVINGTIVRTWRFITLKQGLPIKLNLFISCVNCSISFAFVVCRLFVIVEVVRSLVHLPTGAFRSTWSKNLPHLG